MKRSQLIVSTLACAFFASTGLSQENVYYYQGHHKIPAQLDLGKLAIQANSPASASRLRATIPGTEPVSGHHDKIVTISTGDQPSSIALSARAIQLRKSTGAGMVMALLRSFDSATALKQTQYLTPEFSFRLPDGADPSAYEKGYDFTIVHESAITSDTYIAKPLSGNPIDALRIANVLQESGAVAWASPEIKRQELPRFIPNDPLFSQQWHLQNTGTNTTEGKPGNDINVAAVWNDYRGAGINIAITDDGLETTHPDLAANARTDLDVDINDNDDDPAPDFSIDYHGTAAAGVAAARGNNGIGVSGSAPEASLIGIRLIAAPTTDEDEATGLGWRINGAPSDIVSINSDSWGPPDTGTYILGPGPLTELAIHQGVTEGRGGKGIIYTWAAGNGFFAGDNINKDGYANNPDVIAIGASNSSGTVSSYSEQGTPMLVNAPSSELGETAAIDSIVTTDLTGTFGYNAGPTPPADYTATFGGTSSAAPLVAGVVALMLQANPNLTYRDVMHIFVNTATKNDPGQDSWHTNGAGRRYNWNYGFGRVDAQAAVNLAQRWKNVPALAPIVQVSQDYGVDGTPIPDNLPAGIDKTFSIAAPSNFVVEHVEVETNLTHTYPGDLALKLTAPSGMVSQLMEANGLYHDPSASYEGWRFRTVADWDEHPSGTWTLNVSDNFAIDTGSLKSAILRIYGYLDSTATQNDWSLYQ